MVEEEVERDFAVGSTDELLGGSVNRLVGVSKADFRELRAGRGLRDSLAGSSLVRLDDLALVDEGLISFDVAGRLWEGTAGA